MPDRIMAAAVDDGGDDDGDGGDGQVAPTAHRIVSLVIVGLSLTYPLTYSLTYSLTHSHTLASAGIDEVEDAMAAILSSLPHCSWLITTLGKRGSLLLEGIAEGETFAAAVGAGPSETCPISVGSISAGATSTKAFSPREHDDALETEAMRATREQAARRAALMNADAGKASAYDHVGDQVSGTSANALAYHLPGSRPSHPSHRFVQTTTIRDQSHLVVPPDDDRGGQHRPGGDR